MVVSVYDVRKIFSKNCLLRTKHKVPVSIGSEMMWQQVVTLISQVYSKLSERHFKVTDTISRTSRVVLPCKLSFFFFFGELTE